MEIARAREILDPEHREPYESLEPINEACRMGVEALRRRVPESPYRNLQVLYATRAGEQALDREFGIDGTIIDCPQENAQVLLAAEYVRKTEQYEPRARVVRVEWTAEKSQDGNMIPKVVIELV